MKTRALQTLLQADARAVARDPLLVWVLVLPIGIALLLRLLLPPVREALLRAIGLDLVQFHPLIMGGYLMTAPGLVGMVVGFLLLDERDDRTLSALRVTPLSMRHYLAYRIVLPLALGMLSSLLGYLVVGAAPLGFGDLVVIGALAALGAPILALVLAAAAPNKVAGFAVIKVVNAVNLLPIAAYFLPFPAQLAAGLIPAYWPMRALWSAAGGAPYAAYIAAGACVSAAALGLIASLFERTLLNRV